MTDEDLAGAEAEAEQSQAEWLALEFASLHNPPGERPDPGVIVAARQKAEHDRRRIGVIREAVARAREQARIEALHGIGADALAWAASDPGAEVADALRVVYDAVQAYRAAVAGCNDTLATLSARAAEHADATGKCGPVQRSGDGSSLRYDGVAFIRLGDSARIALDRAVHGDLDGAVAGLQPVRDESGPVRYDHYYRLPDGSILPGNGAPGPNLRGLPELSPAEVDAYLESRRR